MSVGVTATGGSVSPASGVTNATGHFITGATLAPGNQQISLAVTATTQGGATHTVTVNAASNVNPLTITTSSLPSGLTSVSYSAPLSAIGGNGVYAWSLAAGTLPPGLTLSGAGVISGTPSQAGTFNFTVQVLSAGQSRQKALSILIAAPNPWLGRWNGTLDRPGNQSTIPYNFIVVAGSGVNRYRMLLDGGGLYECDILVQANNATFSGHCSNGFDDQLITGQRTGTQIVADIGPGFTGFFAYGHLVINKQP
jgi:hypothetical protein